MVCISVGIHTATDTVLNTASQELAWYVFSPHIARTYSGSPRVEREGDVSSRTSERHGSSDNQVAQHAG